MKEAAQLVFLAVLVGAAWAGWPLFVWVLAIVAAIALVSFDERNGSP